MKIEIEDFNDADAIINRKFKSEWNEIEEVIKKMPLHLKPSRQKGIKGSLIFDPVATNKYMAEELPKRGWHKNPSIPQRFQVLGLDVDFAKSGIIVEVQFSNYPFLSNNVIRTELFQRSSVKFLSKETELLLVITKAHMFPASNSTLYFEQGVGLLRSLDDYDIFRSPVRLVGLFEDKNTTVPAIYSKYPAIYSRNAGMQANSKCRISSGPTGASRCNLQLIN